MELAATPRPENHSFIERLIGAALIHAEIYDEMKRDPNATFQGAIVVLLGAAAGIFWEVMDNSLWALAIPILIPLSLFGWLVGAAVFFIFAKYLFVRHTTWGMADWLLRTMAFASAPNLYYLLTPNNLLGSFLGFGVGLRGLATMVMAIRHGLNVSTGRAIWVWLGTGLVLGMVAVIASIFMIAFLVSAFA